MRTLKSESSNLNSNQMLTQGAVEAAPDEELQVANSKSLYTRDTTPPYIAGYLKYAAFRIPTLLADKAYIYTFAQGRFETHEDFGGEQHILFRRSKDRGKTWESMQTIAKGKKGFACGSMSPVLLGENKLLLMWVEQHLDNASPTQIYTTRSNDGGKSWSEPKNVTNEVKRSNVGQGTWFGVGPSSGIVKKHVSHQGRILIVASQSGVTIRDEDYAFSPSHLVYSDDGGESWSVGATMSVKSKEATLVELMDGNLRVNARNNDLQHRVVGVSRDGGYTFAVDGNQLRENPEEGKNAGKILTDCPMGGSDCGVHSGLLVHPEKNPNTGLSRLVFSSPQGIDFERTIAVLQLSENGGKSWSKQVRYSDDAQSPDDVPGYAGYSNLVSLDGGKNIGVIFERGGTVRKKYLEGKALIENATWQIKFNTFDSEGLVCPLKSEQGMTKREEKALKCRDKVAQRRHHMIDFKIIPYAAFYDRKIAASVEEPKGDKILKCVNMDSSIGKISPQGICE